MLKAKLDDADLALLEVIEDPIWLNEFLRSTNTADMNKENWPSEEFFFRPYQREILSDQSTHIVVTGGRAIGKCQPASARILTDRGYETITKLLKRKSFVTYGYSPTGEYTLRRGVVRRDQWKPVWTLMTSSGNQIKATDLHPILTPKGFVLMGDLVIGDLVAAAGKLPTDHCTYSTISWHELRALGYLASGSVFHKASVGIKPRFKKIDAELRDIAHNLYLNYRKDEEGRVFLERIKAGGVRHYMNQLKQELNLLAKDARQVFRLDWIKNQTLDNIRTFLEAAYAQYGNLTLESVKIKLLNEQYVKDWQELLLYFGVRTRAKKLTDHATEHHIFDIDDSVWEVETLDRPNTLRFWSEFKLPGVSVSITRDSVPPAPVIEWDRVTAKIKGSRAQTYSVHVYKDETYISENIIVHNSVILEDLLTYQIVNSTLEFPKTPEQLLVTPNTNQLTPILDRVILKFTTSPLLKDFLNNNINRAKGTLDFQMGTRKHRLYARIAGSKEANNLVGLHIPKVTGDEFQLFPMTAFYQLQPTINTWEPRVQEVYCGVPNGMRNTALYVLDVKTPKFKKYRIPAPNNPYFTKADWDDAIRRYGGESEDIFQQLILGKHGSPSFQVISRDQMSIMPYDFFSYQYTTKEKESGRLLNEIFPIVTLPKNDGVVFAVDTGFSDPTILQVFALVNDMWRCYARYKMQRIDYPEQEKVIDYLARSYGVNKIAIDVGAGGGGAGIVQSLISRPEYASSMYAKRIIPVQFNEKIAVGTIQDGTQITESFKAWATGELVKYIQRKTIGFSEIDAEGVSQLERVARQRRASGHVHYFVVSPRGHGESTDDHIYASYLCFIAALRERIDVVAPAGLARAVTSSTVR